MQQPAHKEKPAKPATAQAKPVAQAGNQSPRDLRETLEWLRAQGDLIETDDVPNLYETLGLASHVPE